MTTRTKKKPAVRKPSVGYEPAQPGTLRQWCIEQAIRWPVVTEYEGSPQYLGGGGQRRTVDADLIGRAQKILDWVTG